MLEKNEIEKINSENLFEKEEENILEDDIDIFAEIEERRRNNKKSVYCSQTMALMKKTFIVFYRQYKTTLLILSSPLCICIILMLLQLALVTWSTAFIEVNPPESALKKIPKCPLPDDCITIMTLVLDKNEDPKNKEEAEQIMKYVSNKNDLILGKDIIISNTLKNYGAFADYLDKNKNNSEDYFNEDEKTDISKNINFPQKNINKEETFYKHKKNKSFIIVQDLLKDEEIIKSKETKIKSPNKLIISQNYIKKIIYNSSKKNKNSYSNFNDEEYDEMEF